MSDDQDQQIIFYSCLTRISCQPKPVTDERKCFMTLQKGCQVNGLKKRQGRYMFFVSFGRFSAEFLCLHF